MKNKKRDCAILVKTWGCWMWIRDEFGDIAMFTETEAIKHAISLHRYFPIKVFKDYELILSVGE